MPPMVVTAIGSGAGSRDIGRPPQRRPPGARRAGCRAPTRRPQAIVIEANVDDLDPRAWPVVLDALLAAGADDAWLTPILMKKGRPAHTAQRAREPPRPPPSAPRFSARRPRSGSARRPRPRPALARDFRTVEVDGQPIAVKVGRGADGTLLNAMPEWDDVVRAAGALGQPVKRVLAQALAAFEQLPRRPV